MVSQFVLKRKIHFWSVLMSCQQTGNATSGSQHSVTSRCHTGNRANSLLLHSTTKLHHICSTIASFPGVKTLHTCIHIFVYLTFLVKPVY